MCIIIKSGGIIKDEILSKSAVLNPHGGGGTYLDTYEQMKPFDSHNWQFLSGCGRPKLVHFRYATKGKVCEDNNHPFPIGDTGKWLYQNGSVRGLGSEEQVDSAHMANILSGTNTKWWKDLLEMGDSRWAIVDVDNKTHKLYNEDDWVEVDELLYSKKNVPDSTLIAVYGTLKRGGGNNRLLTTSKFIGSGRTTNKYPMVSTGIPFVFDRAGEGHNIVVEIFSVGKHSLPAIDRLENHPEWYERRPTSITMDDGNEVIAQLYFCDSATDTGTYLENFPIKRRENREVVRFGAGFNTIVEVSDLDGLECPFCGLSNTTWDEFYETSYCETCNDYHSPDDGDTLKFDFTKVIDELKIPKTKKDD